MGTNDVGELGRRLRRHREAAGLTQEELAERAGLTAKGISALERGERRRPYPSTVRALADALALTAGERRGLIDSAIGRSAETHDDVPKLDGSTDMSDVPIGVTPLVGRQAELGILHEQLTSADVRLLTLVGPGGVGKTRLAAAAAASLRGKPPFGAAIPWPPLPVSCPVDVPSSSSTTSSTSCPPGPT